MKAVVFEGFRSLAYHIVPDPTLRDIGAPKKFKKGERVVFPRDSLVLFRVIAASICGTDLHILEGTHGSSPPVILGHEYVGEVLKVGGDVESFREGDFVAVDPNIKCGFCDFCRRGMPNHCENMTTLGIFMDGGFAECNVAPAKQLYKLPPDLPVDKAVFFEPVSCVVHSFRDVEPHVGESVLIYGGGTIGGIFAILSQCAGASEVVVVEPSYDRRKVIHKIGVLTLPPGEEPRGFQADVTIDACGVPEVVARAVEFTRHGGRISLFGEQNIHAKVEINPTRFNQKELRMFGSYAAAFDFEDTIQVLKTAPLEKLITHRFTLKRFQEAFDCIHNREGIEIVFDIGGNE